MAPSDASPWPSGWRAVWRLLNRPRPFRHETVRVACMVLLVAHGVIAWLRNDVDHPEFLWIRGGIGLYALLGTCLAHRLDWPALRAYTTGLALLLPLGTAYIDGVLGNSLADLALTALATFMPLMFLQTGRDVALISVLLLAGNIALLTHLPPPAVPPTTVAGVVAAATVSGMVAGLAIVVYRVGMAQSTAWWREACIRERSLREFAELTASSLTGARVHDEIADRVRTVAGGERCTIVLAEGGEGFRVVAATGCGEDDGAALGQAPLSPSLAALMSSVVTERRPIVRETLVALPITVKGVIAGAVIVSTTAAPAVTHDALLVWQAMANQAGVALGNARLLTRLQHALDTKSEFLNTMSHELRSPLHVIVGYADMLLEDPEADARRAAARMRASALELLQLVENTMNVTRLDARRVTLRVEEFAVPDVLTELAECVAALPEGKRGVPVHWEVAPHLSSVRLDRLKFKEIVQNLVTNALKFTPAGSVQVRLDRDGDWLRVVVRDTGVGIPCEAQARIFDMFERLEQGTGPRPAGAGLGLYIVRTLVDLMHGRIEVASEPGAGSCFTLRLPLLLEATAA